MTDSVPPLDPRSSQPSASIGILEAPSDTDKKSGLIKYDVLPPGFPRPSAPSNHPSSLTAEAQPFLIARTTSSVVRPSTPSLIGATAPLLMSPTAPTCTRSGVTNSAALLARARARLASSKNTTPPPAAASSLNTDVQIFEVTHLKTIKCDVCEQKNDHMLYKCQNCSFHHQICSRCVETTESQPAEGNVGRKDWSVHAKLKGAHAAYTQPFCPDRKEDGGYERDGIKFVLAQGKRGGMRKPKKSTPKGDVTSAERNAAVRRAVCGHKSIELASRISQMAASRLNRGQSQEMRDRVAAARERQTGAEAGIDSPVAAKSQTDIKKRKAAVLDQDGADDDDDGKGMNDDGTEEHDGDWGRRDDDDRSNEDMQHDEENGWDELETANALETSVLDTGRYQSGQSSRSDAQYASDPPRVPLAHVSRHRRLLDAGARADLRSLRQYPPSLLRSNQVFINGPAISLDATIEEAHGEPSSGPSPCDSPQPSKHRSYVSAMRNIAREIKTSKEPAGRSFVGVLEPWRNRGREIDSHRTNSPLCSSDDADHPTDPAQISNLNASDPYPPHLVNLSSSDQEADKKAKQIQGQRAKQQNTGAGEKEGLKSQDALGVAMLLQAAELIEDRSRVQELQNQITQLDGPAVCGMSETSGLTPDDRNDEMSGDPSESEWLSNTPSQDVEGRTTASPKSNPSAPEHRGHKRRRSERLASLNPNIQPQNPRKPKRAKTVTYHTITSSESNSPDASARGWTETLEVKPMSKPMPPRWNFKRKWDPLVQSYIDEQRAKRRKTMEWLAKQPSSENEDEYDMGVEGGVWVESLGSEGGLGSDYSGVRGAVIVTKDGKDKDNTAEDDGDAGDADSDPIVLPNARRPRHGRGAIVA